MKLSKQEIDTVWNNLPDNYKEKVIDMYNDAASINDEPLINAFAELFGDNHIKMYKDKYTFNIGDKVKYKSSIGTLRDQTTLFTVQYIDVDNMVRVENVITGVRSDIHINNLELYKSS